MWIYIKKAIKFLSMCIFVTLTFFSASMAANMGKSYVAVVHELSSKTGEVMPPRLLSGSYNVHQTRIDNRYKVVYDSIDLSKHDCEELIKNAINEKKFAYKNLPKEDSRYVVRKKSIFANAYVIDQVDEFISVYYCIPSDIWAEMESQKHDNLGKNIIYENDAILHKNNENFIQKLHNCGITDYSFFHINLPSTPFVCEKYDEKHMVPVQSYDDIIQQ